jgi:hypothetical protein
MACTFVTGAVVPTPALPLLGKVFVCANVNPAATANKVIATIHLVVT